MNNSAKNTGNAAFYKMGADERPPHAQRRKQNGHLAKGSLLGALLATVAVPSFAQAQWTGATDNDWFTDTNWQGDAVPNSDDNVWIIGDDVEISAGNAEADFAGVNDGGSLSVIGASGSLSTNTLLNIDSDLNVFSGGEAQAGFYSLNSGSTQVRDDGSLLNVTGDFVAGRGAGAVSILIHEGGQLTTGRSFVGEGDTTIEATSLAARVTGAGSVWNAGSFLSLGGSATMEAELSVDDGGLLSVNGDALIGRGGLGAAIVSGENAELRTSGMVRVGSFFHNHWGSGTLTISDGGLISARAIQLADYETDAGALILSGAPGARGVAAIGGLWKGAGEASVFFDGGILRATANSTNFISDFEAGDLDIGAGGLFFDSADFDVTAVSGFSGVGDLTKTGSGTVRFSGVNTYTGATTISEGILSVEGGGAITSTPILMVGGADAGLIVDGIDSYVAIANEASIGVGAESGSLTIRNAGTLSSRTLRVGADTPAASIVEITGLGSSLFIDDTIVIGDVGLGAVSISDEATVEAAAVIVGANAGASGALFVADAQLTTGQIETVTGAVATVRFDGGTLTLTAAQADLFSGFSDETVTVDNRGVVIDTQSFDVSSSAVIGGAGGLSKSGSGALTLLGDSLYTGTTTVASGALQLGNGGASGSVAGDIENNSTLIFNRSDDTVFEGVISGNGLISKVGAGALNLTGANSYTGELSVTNGVVRINGDQSAATGLTTVQSGATLGGQGIIGGNVVIADGGILDPGNSPGTLTINSDLALSTGSVLNFEFGEPNVSGGALNDLINVGGDLLLDGTLNVTESSGGVFGPGVYRIFNYDGALVDGGLVLGAMPAGTELFVQTSVSGQVNLANTAGLTLNVWDGPGGTVNDNIVTGGDGVWQLNGDDLWTDISGVINTTYADGGFAIFQGLAGTVTIDNTNGAVTASGLQLATDGYTIAGDALTLLGPQAIIRVGDGEDDSVSATISAELTGGAELLKHDTGTLILTADNSFTGGVAIHSGAVSVSRDANLGDVAGNLSLSGGELHASSSFESGRAVVMEGNGAIRTDEGVSLTLSGAFSNSGVLTKNGAGTLLLNGDSNAYTANTLLAEGTLNVTGVFGGHVDVATGARLEGVGRVGGVRNAGVVAPGGGGFGVLTITGDYAGNGGILEIETVLGSDGSHTDMLVIEGASSGTTGITVINRGGLGSQTVEGIRIIEVGGPSDGAFTLNGDYQFEGEQAVVGGAYAYRLFKNGISDPEDGDWYLRSSLIEPESVDPNPVAPQPIYQPGVPVYEAYVQTLLSLNSLPTLQERVGNRVWAGGASPGDGEGIWGRLEAAKHQPKSATSTSLADKDIDTWQVQIGLDRTLSKSESGAVLIAGINARYAEAKTDVASQFGNGEIAAEGYGVGATLTWYGEEGFYGDAQIQFGKFSSDLESDLLGNLIEGNDGTDRALSIELGKRMPLKENLSVTPQVQLTHGRVDFDKFVDPVGAEVSADRTRSLVSRFGVSIDHQTLDGADKGSHLYGIVNLNYEWRPTSGVEVSATPIIDRQNRLRGEVGLGGSYLWNGRITLYGQASAETAIKEFGDDHRLKGTAGIRIAF